MNETVRKIVDILFQDTAENEETRALHEELMHNCQEHYQDLVNRGLTEDEAISEVVDSLKGMKDMIAEYPKKSDAGRAEAETEEAGGSWHFSDMDSLTAETWDQDLYVSPSPDGRVHVYCDDPKGLTCETAGSQVRIRGVQMHNKITNTFTQNGQPAGEEITLNGILNMVGNAIRNVVSTFQNGAPIRIEVPDGKMKEMEFNSRSGDVQCTCALALKMTARSTSGDVRLEPVEEKTAEILRVKTVSGDAEVSGSAMDAEMTSMSGDVTVDGVFEKVTLRSTSGDVRFSGAADTVNASSVSGDVEISVENRTVTGVEARSTSGDVDIRLPAGLTGVHAECSTTSGECLSRVSDAGAQAPVQIRAKSISGDVTVQ